MNPLVSIIIPVFNQNETHLRDCIDSAVGQSYGNIQIIISDNHSTNGSPNVIAEYQSEKIQRVRPSKFLDMTASFAFAASCANESSKYLSFLSSDDLLAPNAIAELVELAEKNQSAVFVAGNIIQSHQPPVNFEQVENRIRTSKNMPGLQTFKETVALFCPWRLSSTWMAGDLIRHDAYIATGGFAACDYHVLGDLWLTKELLKLENADFGLVGITTAFFRQREEGVLAADGERGLGVYLDVLRYNDEVLKIVSHRDVGYKQRVSIICSSYLVLLKIILLVLVARRYQEIFFKPQEQNFHHYVKNTKRNYERYLIGWVISVEGVPLDIGARLARWLVVIMREGLSRARSRLRAFR